MTRKTAYWAERTTEEYFKTRRTSFSIITRHFVFCLPRTSRLAQLTWDPGYERRVKKIDEESKDLPKKTTTITTTTKQTKNINKETKNKQEKLFKGKVKGKITVQRGSCQSLILYQNPGGAPDPIDLGNGKGTSFEIWFFRSKVLKTEGDVGLIRAGSLGLFCLNSVSFIPSPQRVRHPYIQRLVKYPPPPPSPPGSGFRMQTTLNLPLLFLSTTRSK